ncbi:hypothetical protein [Microvirga pudoricolor]|uniref:hypothetical protein n=1 Tax=Microvirga pudoricolor TaxID=2778729 RepID=UPI00194F390B|nr:hypothetical protein [Microvirga pudoricolor]MBM6593607.1 hypothetical protein [Microvirga pudoricolor]
MRQRATDAGVVRYYCVTDLWFDPVKGFRCRAKGEMIAVRRLDDAGIPMGPKLGFQARGRAAKTFTRADIDYVKQRRGFSDRENGPVVAIAYGKVIRARRKASGLNACRP